jgi:hypothetical protein
MEGLIMRNLIFIGLIFVVLTGCQKETIKSPEIGNISGRVVIDPTVTDAPTSLAGIEVRIIKTNITAYTDTAGEYLFLNIPEGTYSLEAIYADKYLYGHLDGVEVISGGTRKVSDLLLVSLLNQLSFDVYPVILIDSTNNEQTLSTRENLVIGKNFEIQGTVYLRYGGYTNYYTDTTISMTVNKQPPIIFNTEKGWFSSNISLSEGKNSLQFSLGSSENPEYIIDPYIIYSSNSMNSVNIDLNWSSSLSGGGDAGDFDLHLINNQNGDSCWYRNPNPDWGYPGVTFDDPSLQRDRNNYGSSSGSEHLKIISATVGSYTIRVYYYSNHGNPLKTIQPTVNLRLKDNSTIYLTAPAAMKVGDMWTVSQFSFPDGNSLQSVNTIQSGPAEQEDKQD